MTLLRAAAVSIGAGGTSDFGTLFERSLNPGKRSQAGAHYTSREDISRRRTCCMRRCKGAGRQWRPKATALAEAAPREALSEAAAKNKGAAYPKLRSQLQETIFNWVEGLSTARILDSGAAAGISYTGFSAVAGLVARGPQLLNGAWPANIP